MLGQIRQIIFRSHAVRGRESIGPALAAMIQNHRSFFAVFGSGVKLNSLIHSLIHLSDTPPRITLSGNPRSDSHNMHMRGWMMKNMSCNTDDPMTAHIALSSVRMGSDE